jgi:hypothetical protein
MPRLNGAVKAAYESAHEQDQLRTYEDPNGRGHGGVLLTRVELDEIRESGYDIWHDYFFHQPCHDAESVFWVIVAFLLRALPTDQEEKGEATQDGDKEVGRPSMERTSMRP